MRYEICKKLTANCNTTIAWTDTWQWAKEICDSLNCVSKGEFIILKDGKVIKNNK